MNNKDPFNEIKKVIRKSLIDTFSQIILMYYHSYKKDADSFIQIYNSLLDFVIMIENDSEELYKDVINNLEKKYFYQIKDYNPLKIESSI